MRIAKIEPLKISSGDLQGFRVIGERFFIKKIKIMGTKQGEKGGLCTMFGKGFGSWNKYHPISSDPLNRPVDFISILKRILVLPQVMWF